MLKILMLTGDAGEAQEIYYAKYRLEEEGWQVQIAAPEKRVFLSVVHDFEPGFDTYTEKLGYRVTADLGLDDVKAEEFQGLVLPGGRAPEYLRNRPRAVAIVRHFERQ
jgi:protease I